MNCFWKVLIFSHYLSITQIILSFGDIIDKQKIYIKCDPMDNYEYDEGLTIEIL